MDFPQHTGVGQVDSMSDKISFHLYILRCRTSHKYAHVDGPITHHKQRFLNHYTPQMGEREKKKQTMHMETQPPTCTDCWTNHPLWMNVEMHLVLNLAAGDNRVGRPASCYINSEKKKHIFLVFTKKPYIFQYLQTSYRDMKITEKPFKLISNKITRLCFTTKNDGRLQMIISKPHPWLTH